MRINLKSENSLELHVLVAMLILLLSCTFSWPSRADETPARNMAIPTAPVENSESAASNNSALSAFETLESQIEKVWGEASASINEGHLSDANGKIQQLKELQASAGFESFESYSLFLLNKARDSYSKGNSEEVSYLVTQALALSPHSAKALFKAAPFAGVLPRTSQLGLLWNGILHAYSQPAIIMLLLERSVYAVLLAVTLAFYLILLCNLAFNFKELYTGFAKVFRGPVLSVIGIGVLALIVLAAPFAGPLAAVAVWSLLACFYLRQHWIGFSAFILLALWSFGIPLRENISAWVRNPAVRLLLQNYHADFSPVSYQQERNGTLQTLYLKPVDRRRVLQELASYRDDDGLVLFGYGQYLRRAGEYADAESIFMHADSLLGRQPWTEAQLGLLRHLQGDADGAERYFAHAEKLGLTSASFLYNYSRVRFDALDTEGSRSYLLRASKADADLVKFYEERETKPEVSARASAAEIQIPVTQFFSSVFGFPIGGQERDLRIAGVLMYGGSPLVFGILGLLLLVSFFKVERSKRPIGRSSTNQFANYSTPAHVSWLLMFIPGGAWLFAQQPIRAILVLSMVMVTLIPAFGLPRTLGSYDLLLGWWYYVGVALICAATLVVGVIMHGREEL